MAKGFLPYTLDQHLLLPPDMRASLPEGHLALFVSDVVEQMDLSAIFAASKSRIMPDGAHKGSFSSCRCSSR